MNPKSKDSGVTVISGAGGVRVPVPVRETSTGFSSGSLEGIVRMPVFAPGVAGLKTTSRVTELPGARIAQDGSGPEIPNSELSMTIIPSMRLAVPLLLMVTVAGEEEKPVWMKPKSRDSGDTDMSGIVGVSVPVPVSETTTGFSSGSFEGMVKLAVKMPSEVGVKDRVKTTPELGLRIEPEGSRPQKLNCGSSIIRVPRNKLAVPTLLIAIPAQPDVVPTWTKPKSMERGITEISGKTGVKEPVPMSETSTGFSSGSLEGMVNVPF